MGIQIGFKENARPTVQFEILKEINSRYLKTES